MTQEDKYWIGGGAALAIGGGIYWYFKNKKGQDVEQVQTDTVYNDSPESTTPVLGTGNSSSQTNNQTNTTTINTPSPRQPDAVKYSVGQEVMAIGFSGTKAYEAKKMANGQYLGTGTLKATFAKGDKIGKIIWVGALADGTFRYVVQRDGLVLNQIYWIADYRVIQPIGKIVGTGTVPTASNLNPTLLLKKGSKGNEVKELQKRLGFTGTAIDGDFGAKTESALYAKKKVYQITLAGFGITSPSFATPNTGAPTLDFTKVLKVGSKGNEVKELQKRLGFTGSNVDGDFGPKTQNALFAMKKVYQISLNQMK